MKKIYLTCWVLVMIQLVSCTNKPLPTDQWTYIQIDDSRQRFGDFGEPDWLRYFGLDAEDLNQDGYQDIVSGRYVYLSPGGDLTQNWQRVDLGMNVDGMLITDIDDDEFADIVGQALPNVYWLEAENTQATSWNATKLDSIPKTGHVNGQGYKIADLVKGGKPEILMTADDGIYMAVIPKDPKTENWDFIRIVKTRSDEGFAAVDVDQDGDLDIVAGDRNSEDELTVLSWYVNPGKPTADWIQNPVGNTEHAIDRIRAADFNDDQVIDIIVAEERYPGEEPDANLYIFKGTQHDMVISWKPEIIVTQYSMNNLDVADVDRDGDPDIVTNEHKGETHQTQLFINDGNANFSEQVIDTGKEMHLGAQFVDLDGDGDLDLIGHAWDNHQYLHAWRNDAIKQ